MKRESLIARIPNPRAFKDGIAATDILRIPASADLVTDLLDCLHSNDELDQIFALMFAEHLQSKPGFSRLAAPSLPAAIHYALTHSSSRVRASAIRAFVACRDYFNDYSTTMRALLTSTDPQTRKEATTRRSPRPEAWGAHFVILRGISHLRSPSASRIGSSRPVTALSKETVQTYLGGVGQPLLNGLSPRRDGAFLAYEKIPKPTAEKSTQGH